MIAPSFCVRGKFLSPNARRGNLVETGRLPGTEAVEVRV